MWNIIKKIIKFIWKIFVLFVEHALKMDTDKKNKASNLSDDDLLKKSDGNTNASGNYAAAELNKRGYCKESTEIHQR